MIFFRMQGMKETSKILGLKEYSLFKSKETNIFKFESTFSGIGSHGSFIILSMIYLRLSPS